MVKFQRGGVVLRAWFVLGCGFAEISTAAYPCFPGLGVSFKKATFDILKFGMIASLRGHKQTMFIHVYSISLFVSIL